MKKQKNFVTPDPFLEDFPLDDGTHELPRRTIALAFGEVGSGKTTFWLGAPEPVVLFSFDNGVEGVIAQFQKRYQSEYGRRKRIYVRKFNWAPGEMFDQDHAIGIRDDFHEKFLRAVDLLNGHGSILVDKSTDLYGVQRYAQWGAPNTGDRPDYQYVYNRMNHYVELAKETSITLAMIDGMKDQWGQRPGKTGKMQGYSTGERQRNGCDRLDEWVFLEMMHRREVVEDEDGTKRSVFYVDIGKCHQNGQLQDQTFDSLTFPQFGELLIEGSTEKEWL